MYRYIRFVVIAFISLFLSCCFVVRPKRVVEEPKVAVAVLWDTDTIFVTSKNSYTVISQEKIIKTEPNINLTIIHLQDSIKVYKPKNQRLLASPEKVILESAEESQREGEYLISIGKNLNALTPYRRKIVIMKGVTHRFPTKYNLTAINILPIEEYLYGVVSCEIGMAKAEELQAVKAQAVCARSYTMSLLGKRKDFDLYGSYLYDQEYKGKSREYQLSIKAVQETRGEVMQFHREIILAQYHACCGGRTTNGRYPYLKSNIDAPHHSRYEKPYCKDSPYFEWTVKIPRNVFDDSILKLAGIKYKFKLNPNPKLEINKHTKRVDYLKFSADQEYKLTGETIRKTFNLKSTFFTLKIKSDSVEINGYGWGHGIGLCQYGALQMARQKISYKNILKHYYTGIKIVKIF